MREGLGSYTPRVLPLNYDSLESDYGCQSISGTGFSSLFPFAVLCSFDPNIFVADEFAQPDTVYYFKGPATQGNPPPFTTDWAVWISATGIRVGKFSSVTPPANTLGEASSLYPTLSPLPVKVAAAFDRNGFINIAIQSGIATIEIKRYTAVDNVVTKSFTGEAPLMIWTGLVYHSDTPDLDDIACLYLRHEKPATLFARFWSEGYDTEHIIHPELPVEMVRLIQLNASGEHLTIYGTNTHGANVRIASNAYPVQITMDASSLFAELDSLNYFDAAVVVQEDTEEATLVPALESLNYFDAVVPLVGAEKPLPTDVETLTSSLVSIEYI